MPRIRLALCLALLPGCLLALLSPRGEVPAPRGPDPAAARREAWANTFSIVAYDPGRKEWGVAVASKYLAVGAVVPWARAGAGAVATQARVNTTYGTRGLELLAEGKTAEEVVKALTAADEGSDSRQVGVVDARGDVASFTGKACNDWAGDRTGKSYACQGNLLKGKEVVEAMARAFEGEARPPLAWRLLLALEAGEEAGGDKRGKQSAALLVVRAGAGPNGLGDRYLDFRVDDHDRPVQELARLLAKRLPRPPKR
jgi:uncharacterized Ntn-hydrolase superfamily protein